MIDPLEMTGMFLGLSQYPVFKVQAASDSSHYLRFLPTLPAEIAFGGEEIHYVVSIGVSTPF